MKFENINTNEIKKICASVLRKELPLSTAKEYLEENYGITKTELGIDGTFRLEFSNGKVYSFVIEPNFERLSPDELKHLELVHEAAHKDIHIEDAQIDSIHMPNGLSEPENLNLPRDFKVQNLDNLTDVGPDFHLENVDTDELGKLRQ